MRTLLVAAALLVPVLAAPPASALRCTQYLGQPRDLVDCEMQGILDTNPPPPPPVGSPPQAYAAWAQLVLLWAICASHDPPRVQVNDKCGDSDGAAFVSLP